MENESLVDDVAGTGEGDTVVGSPTVEPQRDPSWLRSVRKHYQQLSPYAGQNDKDSMSAMVRQLVEALRNFYPRYLLSQQFCENVGAILGIELNNPEFKSESTTIEDHLSLIPLRALAPVSESSLVRALSNRCLPKGSKLVIKGNNSLSSTQHLWVAVGDRSKAQLHVTRHGTPKRVSSCEFSTDLISKLEHFFEVIFAAGRTVGEKQSVQHALGRNPFICILAFVEEVGTRRVYLPVVIAAVVFVPSRDGTFVSWLGVCKGKLGFFNNRWNNSYDIQGCDIRGCGFGSFLLTLVQLFAVSKNYSPRLLLQANRGEAASDFYRNRSFTLEKENSVVLLPPSLQFHVQFEKDKEQRYLSFVSDTQQLDVPHEQRLCLFSIDTPVTKSATNSGTWGNTMVRFPFDIAVSVLSMAVKKGFKIIGPYQLDFIHKEGVLQGVGGRQSGRVSNRPKECQAQIWEKAVVSKDTYTLFKKDVTKNNFSKWYTDEMVELFRVWITRDKDSIYTRATKIVPVRVVWSAMELFQDPGNDGHTNTTPGTVSIGICISTLHSYFSFERNILAQNHILFPRVDGDHWLCPTFIHPWVHLHQFNKDAVARTEAERYASGLLLYDPMHGCQKPDSIQDEKESLFVLWFLNLATMYHQLLEPDGKCGSFITSVVNRNDWRAFWMMGSQGPFGRVVIPFSTDESSRPWDFHPRFPPVKRLYLQNNYVVTQPDTSNCGPACCLFMMDYLLTQTKQMWLKEVLSKDKKGGNNIWRVNNTCGLGQSLYSQIFYKKLRTEVSGSLQLWHRYKNSLFELFRIEMICLIERLHRLGTGTLNSDQEREYPMNYGVPPSAPREVDDKEMDDMLKHLNDEGYTPATKPSKEKNLANQLKHRDKMRSLDFGLQEYSEFRSGGETY
jgi:hypothetical protein